MMGRPPLVNGVMCLCVLLSVAATQPAQAAPSPAADVSPLKALPVLDNGRVKPFDTVAREVVRIVTGREAFGVVEGEGAGQKIAAKSAPSALVLDWALRPGEWEGRPVLEVPLIELRRT